MGGPIVRSGASPEFSKNWDRIFGGAKQGNQQPAAGATKKPANKKPLAAAKVAKPAKPAKKTTKKAARSKTG